MLLVSVRLSDAKKPHANPFGDRPFLLTPNPFATQASFFYLAAIPSETFSTLNKVPYFVEADTLLTR